MSQRRSNVLTRRRFAGLSMGACLAGLAGCGGGGIDPTGEATLALKKTPVAAGPGLRPQAPLALAGPAFNAMQLKSVTELTGGGSAVAWTRQDTSEPTSLRRLQVRRLDRTGQPAGPVVTLPVDLPDDQSAATVLRDGTTVLAWRTVMPMPSVPDIIVITLWHQRFDLNGQSLAPADVVSSVEFDRRSRTSRELLNFKIDRWPDGSHVVAWASATYFDRFPTLLVALKTLRYHANGWTAGVVVDVGGSQGSSNFTFQTWEVQGGYMVSNVKEIFPPYQQTIRLFDFWNPIDSAYFEGLAEFSYLVPLGVCGSLLFAGHYDPATQTTTWKRQLFGWEGNAVAAPVPLPGRPAAVVPLRQIGQFLELSDSTHPTVQVAQRKDKFDKLYGDPFEVPRGTAVATLGGDLAMASVVVSGTGNYSLVTQRFNDPYGGRDLPE